MTSHISFKITSACIAVLYKKKFFDFYTYVINIFLFVIVHFPVKIHSLQFVDLFIGQLIYLYLLHLNIDHLNAHSLYYWTRFIIVRQRIQSLRALSIQNVVLRKTFGVRHWFHIYQTEIKLDKFHIRAVEKLFMRHFNRIYKVEICNRIILSLFFLFFLLLYM